MFKTQRAWLTRCSFDYQWGQLPDGAGLLTDGTFGKEVDDIISMQELRIDKKWFAGRRVLDAGCGNGRWIEGFLRLGCVVTAFDTSSHALKHVSTQYGDKLEVVQGNLLKIDSALAGRTFDLVWCWGVVHHLAHGKFDLLSTPLNDRSTLEEVTAWLSAAGFTHVVQTMPHTEVLVARRPRCVKRRQSAAPRAFPPVLVRTDR
jgi:SAM-dependent methyltransferase